MADTSITWSEKVWNVTRGCSRVSPGCGGPARVGGCYAERQAYRFSGVGQPYEGLVRLGTQGPRWTNVMRFVVEKLSEPMRWRKPSLVFVDSMSDLFHEGVSNEQIAAVFGVMAACPQHTFQLLTKREKRMHDWFAWVASQGVPPDHVISTCAANYTDVDQLVWPWPLPNVHLGVSVENQEYADKRIPALMQCPASVRWVSYEPALGPVDFSPWVTRTESCQFVAFSREARDAYGPDGLRTLTRRGLDWIVCGGESGSGARPFDLTWARHVIEVTRGTGTAAFVKQLGARPWDSAIPVIVAVNGADGSMRATTSNTLRLRDRKGEDMAEWPSDLRVREWPKGVMT